MYVQAPAGAAASGTRARQALQQRRSSPSCPMCARPAPPACAPPLQRELPRGQRLRAVPQVKHAARARQLHDGLQHLIRQPRAVGPGGAHEPGLGGGGGRWCVCGIAGVGTCSGAASRQAPPTLCQTPRTGRAATGRAAPRRATRCRWRPGSSSCRVAAACGAGPHAAGRLSGEGWRGGGGGGGGAARWHEAAWARAVLWPACLLHGSSLVLCCCCRAAWCAAAPLAVGAPRRPRVVRVGRRRQFLCSICHHRLATPGCNNNAAAPRARPEHWLAPGPGAD